VVWWLFCRSQSKPLITFFFSNKKKWRRWTSNRKSEKWIFVKYLCFRPRSIIKLVEFWTAQATIRKIHSDLILAKSGFECFFSTWFSQNQVLSVFFLLDSRKIRFWVFFFLRFHRFPCWHGLNRSFYLRCRMLTSQTKLQP
jgi:hypothetical protein